MSIASVLILAGPDDPLESLESDLKKIGVHVLGATNCKELVQDTIRLKPELVLVSCEQPSAEIFTATAMLETVYPVPIIAFTQDVQVESMERALASGIHSWIMRGYEAERLRALLQLAAARFRRDKAQREALSDLSARLEERKLVDRAKGILMDSKGMPEEEAFKVLRDAAMQGKQRVGQVASRLIEAARSAEAINRAGQLRMLSQRLVKLRALEALNVEPAGAQALGRASVERTKQNISALEQLLSTATFGDLFDATLNAWTELRSALSRVDLRPASFGAIDVSAERLLTAAERLTAALEAASPVDRMHVVNLAGRQRMLSQRVAKFALLRGLGSPTLDDASTSAIWSYDAATTTLRNSPLLGAREVAILDSAAQSWRALVDAAADPAVVEKQLKIAQSSEELIDLYDRLTERVEHSLKVLVG